MYTSPSYIVTEVLVASIETTGVGCVENVKLIPNIKLGLRPPPTYRPSRVDARAN